VTAALMQQVNAVALYAPVYTYVCIHVITYKSAYWWTASNHTYVYVGMCIYVYAQTTAYRSHALRTHMHISVSAI
jgi:hypothetical protein